ncbi:coiled-coil domain-containing protein 74B-like [Pelodiscus sinensis]|uniref:coiled-coil domain-containing protein 74B-like n=1 Tax=Pelodiscus sinensis TaxID=13735 RepID=UPI003F6D1310
MSNTSLPPLGNLPQWSRVGRLDKSSHLQLDNQDNLEHQPNSQSKPVQVCNKDRDKLVMDLEKSLAFLQQQHAETLMKLHEEIENLRRENKELHYKLIMNESLHRRDGNLTPVSSDKVHSRVCSAAAAAAVFRSSQTSKPQIDPSKQQKQNEEEVVSVVQGEPETLSPKEEKRLQEVISREEREVCHQMTSPVLSLPSHIRSKQAQVPPASSNPFLVNVLPSHIRKPPTLEECEIVIHQLWNINHMQAQELMYLKSYLEDIHKNKRIPEDYLLASQIGNKEVSRLPRMLKDTAKKCLILTPLPAAERAVLPALKQTLGNRFAERQKRTQAIQRSRLRRTVL